MLKHSHVHSSSAPVRVKASRKPRGPYSFYSRLGDELSVLLFAKCLVCRDLRSLCKNADGYETRQEKSSCTERHHWR